VDHAKKMSAFFLCLVISLVSLKSAALAGVLASEMQTLPVQDNGRIKPFDTFAREYLEIVYGKTSLEGRPAFEVILTWMITPEAWQDREIFQVANLDVKKRLGLAADQKRFRGDQIFNSEVFPGLMAELNEKRESKEKLTPYFQALQRLESQYFIFTEIAAGRMLRVLPKADGDSWVSLADLSSPHQESFVALTQAFVAKIGAQVEGEGNLSELSAKFDQAVRAFKDSVGVDQVVSPTDMKIEVFFNQFHPFRWSALLYGLALLLYLTSWILEKPRAQSGAHVLLGLGFGLHVLGFALRSYLTGHPPVTNMYETVVWVGFGAVVFAGVLTYFLKNKFLLLGGSMVASLCMVIADSAPVILDDSIQPLEAVLRSNYWLTIHVLTITISYSAFFLAMALGDLGLMYFIKDEKKFAQDIKTIAQSIYRAIQIGVAFLAPGIILGGIWADYSWGRFWGWDPKETWALIALLGYIAVLHGRLVGWVRDFGMIASGVATFSLVIMAWYGVNFVLGAGLHSYGFGAGGVEYVAGFVLAHLFLIAYAWLVRRERMKGSKIA
jgi:cytochrome c-type biogenesis protein CcsB